MKKIKRIIFKICFKFIKQALRLGLIDSKNAKEYTYRLTIYLFAQKE